MYHCIFSSSISAGPFVTDEVERNAGDFSRSSFDLSPVEFNLEFQIQFANSIFQNSKQSIISNINEVSGFNALKISNFEKRSTSKSIS